MLVNLINESVPNTILLADPILIELSVLAAEFVGCFLTIVSSDVVYEAGEHVCVLRTSADGRPDSRSHAFHQPSPNTENRNDDQEGVCGEEGTTLLGALDPHGVKMHVEFRREVMIHDTVDVL